MALVTFANGARASLVNSVLSPRQETYIRLDCEHATVELTHLYAYKGENWRFTPAESNGIPAPAEVLLHFDFANAPAQAAMSASRTQ